MPETIGAGIGSCCAEMKKPPAVSARPKKKKLAQSHTDFATRNRKDKIERQQRKKKSAFGRRSSRVKPYRRISDP
jgi:hypothetical protein